MNWPDPTTRPPDLFWRTAARNRYLTPVLAAPTWQRWRWMSRAFDGATDKLSEEGRRFVTDRLGGALPTRRPNEIYLVAGRQGGKSRWAATCLLPALALFPGVRPPCSIIIAARSKDQTRQLFGYASEALRRIPGLVVKPSATVLELSNGVTVERVTSDYRTVRSRVLAAVFSDELSFWDQEDDKVKQDVEFLNAIGPALRTRDQGCQPGLHVGLSSPWRKAGVLYDAYDKHFGQPGRVMVMQGATDAMRPTIDRAELEAERAKDSVNYGVEYGANFRLAQYGFLRESEVDACVDRGVTERPPAGHDYSMFVDHSSGHGRDPASGAVGHCEDGRWVVDAIRVVDPPFTRSELIGELSLLARRYRVPQVVGDQWDGVVHTNAWRDAGFRYEPAPMNKTKLYLAAMPRIVEGSVRLLDNPRLRTELLALERRTTRSSEAIDHPPNQHDDVANAVCGLVAGEQPSVIRTIPQTM